MHVIFGKQNKRKKKTALPKHNHSTKNTHLPLSKKYHCKTNFIINITSKIDTLFTAHIFLFCSFFFFFPSFFFFFKRSREHEGEWTSEVKKNRKAEYVAVSEGYKAYILTPKLKRENLCCSSKIVVYGHCLVTLSSQLMKH